MPTPAKLKVFVSYSRADMAFAERLVAALEARGLLPKIDTRDLPKLEDWRRELQGFIREADAVVFIVSTHSVSSPICAWEIDQVATLNKRLAPVVLERVDDDRIPNAVSKINYLFFDRPDGFDVQVDELVHALQTDLTWVREHTRLGELAHRWEQRQRSRALLVRAQELQDAEHWLASHPASAPEPTTSHWQFLAESRKAATRRQRSVVLGSLTVALMALGLAGLALWQRNVAVQNETAALAARSAEAEQRATAEKNEKRAEEERDRALITQSRFLADTARRLAGEHDFVSSAMVSLEGLPGAQPRPYVTDAEHSLYNAYVAIREKRVFQGHKSEVFSVVLSPDKKRLASASKDGTARIFDVSSGRTLAVLQGHMGRILSVAFAPDGRRILTGSLDGTARIWDAFSGAQLFQLTGHEAGVHRARFDASGGRVVTTSSDQSARIWDAGTGKLLHSLNGHLGIVWDASFSPDGNIVATASMDNMVRLWSATDGKLVHVLGGHTGQTHGVRFSPDGKFVMAWSHDKTARIWAVATGNLEADLVGHQAILSAARWSPDGATVVTGSDDGDVRVWSIDGQLKRQLTGHRGRIHAIEFSPSGRLLATAGDDGAIRVWNVAGGGLVGAFRGHVGSVSSVAFVDEGHLVSAGADATLRLWSLRPINVLDLAGHDGPVNSAVFSRDGRLAITASSDRTARVWDAATGSQLALLGPHSERVFTAIFDADAKRAFTGDGPRIRVWDVQQAKELSSWEVSVAAPGLGAGVSRLALSRDGIWLASVSDFYANVFDAATGQRLQSIKTPEMLHSDVQFSQDGATLLTAGSGPLIRQDGSVEAVMAGAARLWNIAAGTEIRLIDRQNRMLSATLLSDARSAVTVTYGWLRRWSAESGSLVTAQQLDHATHLAESSDASLAITRFREPAVLRRALDQGAVASFGSTESNMVQFSSDGNRAISAHHENIARIWPVFRKTEDLVAVVLAASPRCLAIEQRRASFLTNEPPHWCLDRALWPFDDDDWREWRKLSTKEQKLILPDERGDLSVTGMTMSEEVAKTNGIPLTPGVLVSEAHEGAARAGLRAKDVIVRINGKQVTTDEQLIHELAWKGEGASVEVGFLRDGNLRTTTVRLDHIEGQRFDAGGSPMEPNSRSAIYWAKERFDQELQAGEQLLASAQGLGEQQDFAGALRGMDQVISRFAFLRSSSLQANATEEARAQGQEVIAEWTNQQAWFALLSQNFRRGLAESRKAIALLPAKLDYQINYAHALLFNGQTDEARAIYLGNRGKTISNGQSWESILLEDFAALEKAGSKHDAMTAISRVLQETQGKRDPDHR